MSAHNEERRSRMHSSTRIANAMNVVSCIKKWMKQYGSGYLIYVRHLQTMCLWLFFWLPLLLRYSVSLSDGKCWKANDCLGCLKYYMFYRLPIWSAGFQWSTNGFIRPYRQRLALSFNQILTWMHSAKYPGSKILRVKKSQVICILMICQLLKTLNQLCCMNTWRILWMKREICCSFGRFMKKHGCRYYL